MRAIIFVLTLGVAAIVASPRSDRIVGGSVVNISNYPMAVSLLYSRTGAGTFVQSCVGSIINNRSVLTSAYCLINEPAYRWRSRVGSSYAHSGGVVHNTALIITHPSYNFFSADSDIAVLRISSTFSFNNNVRAGSIAGAAYNVPDNQTVWAIGWGRTAYGGYPSEQLRHVQIWTINLNVCRQRYATAGYVITDNMLCSGWLDVGGRDQCSGDYGGPLLSNNVIVGVFSWGQCALPFYPSVNTRVSRFTNWVLANA